MAGRLGGALLLYPTASTVNNISCKNLNPCSASQAFSLCPSVFSLKFHMFSIVRSEKFTLRNFNPSSRKNNSVVLGTRDYSSRSFRSERDRDNEPLSAWRRTPKTTSFNARSTNRRDTESKSLVEEELEMDNLFGKRGASMSGRSKPGRNDYNDGSSRNSRGNGVSARGRRGGGGSFNGVSARGRRGGGGPFNGVSARGRRGEGDLLNRRGSKSFGVQGLKISDDEDEDESEDENESEDEDESEESDSVMDVTSSSDDEDKFDSVKPVGHKQPMLSAVKKADPKTSGVKVTGDANYLSQSR